MIKHDIEWVPPSEWRIDYSRWITDLQLTPQVRAEVDRALVAGLAAAEDRRGEPITGLLRIPREADRS